MNKPLALQMEWLFPWGPVAGAWMGVHLQTTKVRFCFYQVNVFIGNIERYIIEGSGNWQPSP